MHLSSQRRSPRAVLILLPVTLVALAGCSDLAVRLGLRTRLDKLPVTSIAASLVGKDGSVPVTALAPGAFARLVVVASTQDGRQFVTVGAGHGKVLLDSFVLTPDLVQLGRRGKVSMPADPRLSDGKVASIHIATVGHPDVITDLDIAVRYDVAFVADYSGADGMKGIDGSDGLDGLPGSDANPAPPDPLTGLPGPEGAGGDGGNGGNGGDGGAGGDGAPGAAVHVWLRLKSGTDSLLQAKVSGGARDSYYLVEAKGGSLKVAANGGSGGDGGAAGRAGRGGSGGTGNPSGLRGRDGFAGSAGWRGNDGAAGTITVSVDPAAQPFVNILSLSNHSGSGRPGPAPSFVIEPVPPLW
jgi:hypothetical protein